jgi:hypothetical protein
MKFIRAGNVIVNLDQITYIKIDEDRLGLRVYFTGGESLALAPPQSNALIEAAKPLEFHDVASPR